MFEKWIEEHREQIIENTQGVLRINSVGGPASAPNEPFGPGCAEALDYVLNLGQEMGFTVKNVDGYAGHIEFGEGEEYIAVLGHLDVVPVGTGWTYPPFGAEIHNGKIYARGAIDDKGPTMAALHALHAVKESGVKLSKKIRVILGVDEESNWRCMDYYFEKEPKPIGGFTPDADFPLIYAEKGILCFDVKKARSTSDAATVLVREVTGGNRINMVPDHCAVVLDVKGELDLVAAKIKELAESYNIQLEMEQGDDTIKLHVAGVSVHAAAPHHGVNAIVQAARILAELDTAEQALWQFISEVDTDGDRLGIKMVCAATGPLTNNMGLVHIDEKGVKLAFNVRFPVDQTDDGLLAIMQEKLGPEGYSVEKNEHANMAPLYVPKDSEIVTKLLKVYEEETGEQAEPLTIGGGTYARAIPNAVAFGALFPGQEELAHQRDENWAVDDLIRCTKIYAKAIYELAR
ncbi:dipeptidase PepV [Tumebacillus sp. ITR2]|uniref:Dipeptidase PepV n=1 Tax=Tumebacillus amylolyticus TaxID=2801339 RepID=A0ABS1JBU6_9BACL|nr:dipeptidase PepV [Tumebacillus amylolyticus]MBL0387745.1 dipeptidase PepV [Tumebacillus amylolyticus]